VCLNYIFALKMISQTGYLRLHLIEA